VREERKLPSDRMTLEPQTASACRRKARSRRKGQRLRCASARQAPRILDLLPPSSVQLRPAFSRVIAARPPSRFMSLARPETKAVVAASSLRYAPCIRRPLSIGLLELQVVYKFAFTNELVFALQTHVDMQSRGLELSTTSPVRVASGHLKRRAKTCFACGCTGVQLKKCARCLVARYCSVRCQRHAWLAHKLSCRAPLAAVSPTPSERRHAFNCPQVESTVALGN
jgi:hypothetical protein